MWEKQLRSHRTNPKIRSGFASSQRILLFLFHISKNNILFNICYTQYWKDSCSKCTLASLLSCCIFLLPAFYLEYFTKRPLLCLKLFFPFPYLWGNKMEKKETNVCCTSKTDLIRGKRIFRQFPV